MPSICKCLCQQKTDIFVNKSKTNLLGIDVYYCRACNIYIKFKIILTNFINTIFHKQLQKLRCGCCSNKLRTTLRRKILKENRENKYIKCACGCGELRPPRCDHDKKGTTRKYIKNHHHRKLLEIANRHCLFCNGTKTSLNRNALQTPIWYRYEHGYLCNKCYINNKRGRIKINNNQQEQLLIQK